MRRLPGSSTFVILATLIGLGGCEATDARRDGSVSDLLAIDAFEPAPHAPQPQVPYQGGHLLKSVQLVTITFADDSARAAVEAFGDWIVQSDWLTSIGAEYGIGAGRHVAKVALFENAPAQTTDTAIRALIADHVKSKTLPTPPSDFSDYLYVIYFPPQSRIVDETGFVSACNPFGGAGYHADMMLGTLHLPYAVVIGCPTPGTQLANTTLIASHEIMEAITDPLASVEIGYAIQDSNDPWSLNGEIGDLCYLQPVVASGYSVQRIWSNAAAARGDAPCVPASPDKPFFNVFSAQSLLPISPGGVATFELTAWSTAPMPAWSLKAIPGGGTMTVVSSLGASSVRNGQVVTATVTAPPVAASGSFAIVDVLSLRSPGDYRDLTHWPIGVYVP